MLLISHIIIALLSLGLGTYSYFKLSKNALYATYVFGAGTLASGVWLLVSQPSHLVSACITGLVYFALLGAMVLAAQHRLATTSR